MSSGDGDSMPLYTERWMGSGRLREATAEQKGCYIDLLAASWDVGGLPMDWRRSRAWAPWNTTDADLQIVVEMFFPPAKDGRRRNPKQEKVRAERRKFIAGQSDKGRKSAEAKAARKAEEAASRAAGENRNSTPVATAVATAVDERLTKKANRTSTGIQPAAGPCSLQLAPAHAAGPGPQEEASPPLVGLAPDQRDSHEPYLDFAAQWRNRLDAARVTAGSRPARKLTAAAGRKEAIQFRLLATEVGEPAAMEAAEWVTRDPFWRGTCGSLTGLRRNWDSIQGARAKRGGTANGGPRGNDPRTAGNLDAANEFLRRHGCDPI